MKYKHRFVKTLFLLNAHRRISTILNWPMTVVSDGTFVDKKPPACGYFLSCDQVALPDGLRQTG